MEIIKKLLSRISNRTSKAKGDELLGFWENDADDGSGFHAIWGYGIEFLADGKGFAYHWGSDIDVDEKQRIISWKRNNATNIMIRSDENDAWTDIGYEITNFIGAYNAKDYKLTENGKNGFWTAPEPLYKARR